MSIRPPLSPPAKSPDRGTRARVLQRDHNVDQGATIFTGIVRALGTVLERGVSRLVIRSSAVREPAGASVAVNGCCLTVVSIAAQALTFDLLPDTLERTNLGLVEPGDLVNLEPALGVGDAMGGHWVQGHVDAIGTVVALNEATTALDAWLDVPADVLRYCVERGSIAVDGVSLTVMELGGKGLRVSLVAETRSRTTLGRVREGSPVNLEADVLARYVERLLTRAT